MSRVCAERKTNDFPNVYTRTELIEMAIDKELIRNPAQARKLTKQNLCNMLGIEYIDNKKVQSRSRSQTRSRSKRRSRRSRRTRSKTRSKKEVHSNLLDCNIKGNKSAPSKQLLVRTAIATLGMDEKEAVKYSREELCNRINNFRISVDTEARRGTTCLGRGKIKLLPHQLNVVEHMRRNRGLVVVHGVGSGKTLTAIASAECMIDADPNIKIFIVAPVSLIGNFKKEMVKYGVNPNDHHYYFYSHDSFIIKYQRVAFPSNSYLIIDEGHRFRTYISDGKKKKKEEEKTIKQAKVMVRLASQARKVLILTATPVFDKPYDVVNLVAMVKGRDPLTPMEFRKLRNDPIAFKKYFSRVFSFYEPGKEGYPAVNEISVYIPMTAGYYKQYREVESKNGDLIDVDNPWAFLMGMRKATIGLNPCQKCDWVNDKMMTGERNVIYSAFRTAGVEQLKERADKEGIPYIEITGRTKEEDRTKAVELYNNGTYNNLFITKAGAEGLDLKETDNIIFLEKGYNRALEEQIIGRGARYHSHKDPNAVVNVYHLILVKPKKKDAYDKKHASADEKLEFAIIEKDKENRAMLGDIEQVSIENLNF